MPHIVADRVLETTTTTGTGAITLAAAVAGFRRFNAVCSVNDTVPYFIEAVDANNVPTGDWESGVGTYSAANTLTRTTVLASSNAGAAVNFAAGTKLVSLADVAARALYFDDVLSVNVPVVLSDPPAAPPSNNLRLFARARAGRMLPAFIGPSGVDNVLQPQLWGNRIMLMYPGSGTALGSFGLTPTTAATLSHPAPALTTLAESMYRTRFATSTTAGNASGARDAVNTIRRGANAGEGGFFSHVRFCSGSVVNSGEQKIIGFSSSTGALAGEPSALADVLGMGRDSGDANWQFMRRTGTGTVQKVNLGVAVATNQTFDLTMFCAPNGSSVNVRIVQYTSTGGASTVVLDTTYNTDLPAAGTQLSRHFQVRNGALTLACNMELVRWYLESDF